MESGKWKVKKILAFNYQLSTINLLRLYNTLTRKIEEFISIKPPHVGLYTCGMTVYSYAHIGHGKKYIGDDLLRRTLEYLGYRVKHVQNVTDVGHLVSDADEGEDKIEKGARKYDKTPQEISKKFANQFFDSMEAFNVLKPHIVCWASKHIKEQIEIIKVLEEEGYAYDTPEAVYFDISKFGGYENIFNRGALSDKKVAVRGDIETGKYKKHPADFALWFKLVGRFKDHLMHWPSPWGEGFPGWHIECSAMSMRYLGETFDIHTGGEDHIATHHPNEIAQSEAATGKKFVNYWLHHVFLKVEGRKMGKSLGNLFTVEDLVNRGYDPLAFRYLCLQTHYRKPLNFTWEALEGAQKALGRLRGFVGNSSLEEKGGAADTRKKFISALEDDLNVPKALSVVWDLVSASNKGEIDKKSAISLILEFDKVLGLKLSGRVKQPLPIPENIAKLVAEREKARKSRDYAKSDRLRSEVSEAGYSVEDTSKGPKVCLSSRGHSR